MSARVAHVITGLSTGGAETMLLRLLAARDTLREGATVISLRDEGTIGPSIAALGVPVRAMDMRHASALGAIPRVRQALAAARADVVQGWMYHGNLAALLAPRGTPVLWNVRQSIERLRDEKAPTAAVILAGGVLSGRARAIIYNSSVSARQHEALGYRRDRTRLIPNGFDLDRFRPDESARARLRSSLGLPADALVVGHLGRYHPVKDHANFLAALGLALPAAPKLQAVLAGQGVVPGNPALAAALPAGASRGRIHLLGEVDDTPALMAGLDILCLSSAGEGFPNVVGEAMACGVPCVVTDAGDAALLLGDAGLVVPRRDSAALAAALLELATRAPEARAQLGRLGRRRVAERYSIAAIAATYAALYEEVRPFRSS